MTQLELVYNEQVFDLVSKPRMIRTVIAVSPSYSALVEYCDELGFNVDKSGCGKNKYYSIKKSNIKIIRAKY